VARLLNAASTQYFVNASAAPISNYPFAVSARIRPTGSGTNRTVFCLGKTGTTERHLLYLGTGDGLLAFSGNGGTFGQATDGGALTAGTWYQVGGQYSTSSSRQAVVNGSLSSSETTSVAISAFDRVYLGAYYNNGLQANFYGNQDMAEVGVWSAALLQDEWTALGQGVSPLFVRPSALVAYWPLLARSSAEEDWAGSYALTNTNAATASDHPSRVLFVPQRRPIWTPDAAPPASFQAAWVRRSSPTIGAGVF
jgi:hypothetical protein